MRYVALGMIRDRALKLTGITRHQFYYKPFKGKKRGVKPSLETIQIKNGERKKHPNSQVVECIEHNHSDSDLTYGYRRMTAQLQIEGYEINHKKVYRLMHENQLLATKERVKKNYAKYRILTPSIPLEMLEMDIKFVWIEQQRRHAFILTVLDVFTRTALEWHIGFSITQHTVKQIWESVITNHLQTNDMLNKGISIEVRNDNDPRFSAKMVQEFFETNHLNQVFTHPYTPQENGHIESFHAILGKSLDQRHFDTLEQAQMHLTLFYMKYNQVRLHGSIANLAPMIFWKQWELGNIRRIELPKKKIKFKLLIPYHQISGNEDLREVSCLDSLAFDRLDNTSKENGAISLNQPSVQKEPSVVSC